MYEQIDLALDTFPYNGVTTTFEALWQTVPVLTLRGDNFLSRNGYSILKNLGINDLIAKDEEDYISKAVSFSDNLKFFECQPPLFDLSTPFLSSSSMWITVVLL